MAQRDNQCTSTNKIEWNMFAFSLCGEVIKAINIYWKCCSSLRNVNGSHVLLFGWEWYIDNNSQSSYFMLVLGLLLFVLFWEK